MKLTIGTSTAGTPIVIPEEFTLRVYTNEQSVNFNAKDRWGNNFGGNQALAAANLLGLPYWNGTAEQTATGILIQPWIDFDGRTYAEVTPNQACPFAFLMTDPTKGAPNG